MVASGDRIPDAIIAMGSDKMAYGEYLREHPEFQTVLNEAQAIRVDLVLDEISYLIETVPDVARVKVLKDFWLEMAKKQSPDKYGDKSKVTVSMSHESALDELELLE